MLTNTERQQIVEEVNAGTYGIDEALDDIAAAQKGEEVRKALYAEALVLNREGHAGSTDMIARQQIANLQTSVNGQISTLRTEVGDDIDDLEAALNSGLATQNGKIAAQDATIANVVANYNVEYGSTELWASTGETGALAAGTTVTLSEDVSHFDYIDIYSFCGNSNVLDTVPVDAKLQSSQGYALRWVNLSDPDSGSYKAYVRIIETRLHIIGTTLTIDHQVTYRNGEEVNISGAEITQANRSTYVGELGIMKIVGRKITANTEIEDVRIGADSTEYASAGQAVRAQVNDLKSAIPAIDDGLNTAGAAADAKAVGSQLARVKSTFDDISETTNNLFDKAQIIIGVQASGQATNKNRALSGPMMVGGNATIRAFNLPSNIKYEIEYYTGESANTYAGHVGGWVTDTNARQYSGENNYIRILFSSVNNLNFSKDDFADLDMQVETGDGSSEFLPHYSAVDIQARDSIEKINISLEPVETKNIFDKAQIIIGVQASGQATNKNRALSGAMYINGQTTITVINLPSNIKYEIEYYTGEAASTYVKSTNKWWTETGSLEFADNYPFMRLLFGSVDNTDLSLSDFQNLAIVVNKGIVNTDYIKVCTWNVGLWYNGNPHGMDLDLLYKWYRIIGSVDADIFMTQESPESLSDGSELTVTDLMDIKYDYINLPIAGDGIYQAKTICAKHPFFDVIKRYYSVGSRLYWKAYIYLNNKKVCIINTHLTVDDTYRPTQLQELLNLMIAEDYVIVCGDFNVKATTEFDIFTNAGFKLANCGIFGDFVTCPNDTNNKMLDNCIVSSNITIQNVETVSGTGTDYISDHVALLTTLRI